MIPMILVYVVVEEDRNDVHCTNHRVVGDHANPYYVVHSTMMFVMVVQSW